MKKAKKFISNIAFMFKYSWSFTKSRYFIALINIILDSVQPIFTLMMPKYIIDELTNGRRWNLVVIYILALVGINLALSGIRELVKYASSESSLKSKWKFSMKHGVTCSTMDYSKLENSSVKDKVNQSANNTDPINFVDNTVTGFITNVIQLAGYTYIIATLHPLVILFILLLIFIASLVTKGREKLGYEYQPIFAKFSRKFNYLLNAMIRFDFGKEVRINKASTWLEKKFADEIDEYMCSFGKSQRGYLRLSIFDAVLALIQTVVMYGYAVYKTVIGDITVGSFSVYLGSVTLFTVGFRDLINKFIALGYLSKYVDDYKECLSLISPSQDQRSNVNINVESTGKHEIVFDHVSFKYPNTDRYVLRNISIKIEAGKKLSVVGYNGAGKTTFIKLICRLYEPTEGKIYYNGIDVSTIDYTEYVKLLSVVFQDFALFYFTIKDNIVFGKERDSSALKEAIEKSGLGEKIDGLKDGWDTPLSKEFYNNGIEFSGGEGQKLACARAYYKDAPIIIFDEPTAALDAIAESQLYERFNNIIENKTAIYISHRLASVKFCDSVAVFADGKIVEYGTHNELMALGGVYTEMFNKQSQFYVESKTYEK